MQRFPHILAYALLRHVPMSYAVGEWALVWPLHHLFRADEMLGPILLTTHNLHSYQRLTAGLREAIVANALAVQRHLMPVRPRSAGVVGERHVERG